MTRKKSAKQIVRYTDCVTLACMEKVIAIGETFRLIGSTQVFRAVALYLAGGFVPSVEGHTLDGKFRTRARVADVAKVNSR